MQISGFPDHQSCCCSFVMCASFRVRLLANAWAGIVCTLRRSQRDTPKVEPITCCRRCLRQRPYPASVCEQAQVCIYDCVGPARRNRKRAATLISHHLCDGPCSRRSTAFVLGNVVRSAATHIQFVCC